MQIETILLDDYIDSPVNPRIMFKEGDFPFDSLNKSIEEFDYLQPMIVNKRSHHIISGHLRKRVLMAKGITKAEAVIVDFEEIKERAAVIAFNKISGEWDEEKLASLLSELAEIPEFDVGLTGFDTPEISQLLDSHSETKGEDDFDFDGCLDSIKEPITKEGDLIQLGPHRIFCGDASNLDHIKLLLGDEKIHLLHTDPPYNVAYYGGNRPNAHSRPKKHKLWDRIYSDDMTQEKYEAWLRNIFSNINPYFAPGAPTYVWNGHKQFSPMYLMLTELGFHVSCIITWAKERFAIGFGDYNQQTEFCLYGWKENNGSHSWYGPNNESTLWEVHRDLTRDYIHPTQKPIALAQRAIKNSSKRSDLVLDMFLGSGSTLIAAESLQRRCFGLEIDPRYCDAIVRRFVSFVGESKVSEALKQKYLKEVSQ